MRVLGFDPGLRLTGYGCVEVSATPERARSWSAGGALDGGERLVEAGVVRLQAGASISDRLASLEADVSELLSRLKPEAAAVERLYAHYKHPATAIIMGHARGVILLGIRRAGVRLIELAATEVKKSTTGNGHAGKAQMQSAIQAQLGLQERPKPADIADAIAIALCALRRQERGSGGAVGALLAERRRKSR